MLLRHTPKEINERSAVTINPAKTCQPVGAMYAALGVKGCFPHSHGSQGCCAYHRSALTRHYKEPVVAGTSSTTTASATGAVASCAKAPGAAATAATPNSRASPAACRRVFNPENNCTVLGVSLRVWVRARPNRSRRCGCG